MLPAAHEAESVREHPDAGSTRATERSSVASWEAADLVLPSAPPPSAAPARQSEPLVDGADEEEDAQKGKAPSPSSSSKAAVKQKQEQKEQVLDKLLNFKAAPKPSTPIQTARLGELRHLDSIGLPDLRSAATPGAPSPSTQVPPGLWDAQVPARAAASVPALPFQLPPASMPLPASGGHGQPEAEPMASPTLADTSRVTEQATQPRLLEVTASSIDEATAVARGLGTLDAADVEQAVGSAVESLMQLVEDGVVPTALTMDHFTLLRLVGKVNCAVLAERH